MNARQGTRERSHLGPTEHLDSNWAKKGVEDLEKFKLLAICPSKACGVFVCHVPPQVLYNGGGTTARPSLGESGVGTSLWATLSPARTRGAAPNEPL